MKASFFVRLPYGHVREPVKQWPVPNRLFDAKQAVQVAATRLDDVQLADELGFGCRGRLRRASLFTGQSRLQRKRRSRRDHTAHQASADMHHGCAAAAK